ncbi:ropporin-1-like protein isoform X1 [Homo sapiens]|uniref:ropporin-1-like protein isoform X1 n=1 Tax=Homo sapiens TaxID=9606 RepID=UPI0003EAF233|nr:ropporin-1-like protein isoform X1 [Homo sapiens]|eukprot:XP_006714567.1 ropporin-1-like protein isoform X1 [Homo sapiens]
MPLPDTMFCAQQIHIPPELPDILKQFTKAAIRTQPADVLRWSAGYFSALSRGDPLPVKDRMEMPTATQKTDTGLTQGLLKVLHKQCHHKRYVELTDLEQKWKNLCLPKEKFKALLQLDPCENKIKWINFLALGCSMLGGSLNTALKHLCEILTDDPEGGPARIPFKTFSYVYRYLARLDSDVSPLETESYLASLKENMIRMGAQAWLRHPTSLGRHHLFASPRLFAASEKTIWNKRRVRPATVVHAYNPSTLGGRGR